MDVRHKLSDKVMPQIKDFPKQPDPPGVVSLSKVVLATAICATVGLSTPAQSVAYEWYFNDFRSEGVAEAAFGNPQSDERLIRFTCSEGVLEVQGPLASTWTNAGDADGTLLRISFTMPEGQRQVIDAEIAEGDGLFYSAKIAADNPIIAALIAGKIVRVQRVSFRQALEVPGRGAARPMRSLLQACAAQKPKRP
jgi:hypothetical protein